MTRRRKYDPAREVSQDELERLSFESGQEIQLGVSIATLKTDGGVFFARLSRPAVRHG